MKALVTGGAGFIGSHLVDRLIAEGYEVTVLDDLSTGRRENVHADAVFYACDIASLLADDEDLLWREIKATDIVFHLAAAVGVQLVMEEPAKTLMTNLRGTENVLGGCAGFGKRVVLASSSEVYGKRKNDAPIREDETRRYGPVTQRRWAYAESKAIDEYLALAYRDEGSLDARIARLFNTVGPRQTGAYGMVVPRFASAAVAGRAIEVYGDGHQTRSFCHVSDIVNGLILLAEREEPTWPIFNLGNPWNHIDINALAKEIRWIGNPNRGGARTTGSQPRPIPASNQVVSEIVHIPYEDVYGGIADMRHRRPDISRAYSDLGWTPTVPLRAILDEAVREAERGVLSEA